jgi:hypothetical protein
MPAPDVALDAVVGGQVRRVRLGDFRRRGVELFLYPLGRRRGRR